MSRFDKLSEQQASLQILIDQYNDADDYDERDEVLADIAAHQDPAAAAFLELVASQDDDPSTRCDAVCALHRRRQSAASAEALLPYLNGDSPYSLVAAAAALASHPASAPKQAVEALWAASKMSVPKEALVSLTQALEELDSGFAATASRALLQLAAEPELNLDLAEVLVGALALQDNDDARQTLEQARNLWRDAAKVRPDDSVVLLELAEAAEQAALGIGLAIAPKVDEDDEE